MKHELLIFIAIILVLSGCSIVHEEELQAALQMQDGNNQYLKTRYDALDARVGRVEAAAVTAATPTPGALSKPK